MLLLIIETFIAITIAMPLFLIFGLPLLFVYLKIQKYFFPCRRQVQRITSVARSPLYVHFSETLDGYVTIRAFRSQKRFISGFTDKVNTEAQANFTNLTLNRWLAIRLETIGTLLVASSALFTFGGSLLNLVTAALGGLALTYSIGLTQVLNWTVRMAGDAQSQLVSVERVEQYRTTTPVEAPLRSFSPTLGVWPTKGHIQFKNYCLRYRPELPLVLNQLNFEVQPSTKVGIIGRTGAGKSSVFGAILRLVEPTAGTILIDGVDITHIGLHDLRSSLAVIPQDPVLFAGSLRFNVDPFSSYTDAEIWLTFERVHLKSFVENELNGNLNYKIEERGNNVSQGQRQLICFARALLKNSKILLLDEATSSFDPLTDSLIQSTLRTEFNDCTILTIAHRIETIIDYDEVILLDYGQIAEQGPPSKLKKIKNGKFHQLCIEGNIPI